MDSFENLLWVDKYKPAKVNDIVGNKSNIQKIIQWLNNWYDIHVYKTKEKPKFVKFGDNLAAKALILSGPPGIGKTSMATLIASENNFDIQEMNASDDRTKSIVDKEINQTNSIHTIFKYMKNDKKKHKVIIMDEVDGLSSSDRGGITALIESIKDTKVPIICICNDRHKPALKSLINYCLDIRVSRPDKREILKRMWTIVNDENLNINMKEVEQMIESSGNDIRNTIHNLQFYSYKKIDNNQETKIDQKLIDKDDLSNLSIFESSKMILSHNVDFNTKYNLYFNDYDMTPLFIQENYIKSLSSNTHIKKDLDKINKLALSSELLSDLDFIDSHSSKTNGTKDWNVLPFNAALSACIGNTANGPIGFPDFPQYLGKNSTKRKNERYVHEMSKHRIKKIKNCINDSAFRLEYIPLLQTKLTQPLLKNKDSGGVKETLKMMNENGIDKDDLQEKLQDLYISNINEEFKYEKVDSKIKTSLTREWNKLYEIKQAKKTSKKKRGEDNDSDSSDEETENDNEEDKLLDIE